MPAAGRQSNGAARLPLQLLPSRSVSRRLRVFTLWAGAAVTGASVTAWTTIKDLLLLVIVLLVVGLIGHAGSIDTLKSFGARQNVVPAASVR